jgi:hypothetical protein
MLDAAYWIAKPVSILVANAVKKLPEEKHKDAIRELGCRRFVVDDVQLTKLVSLLKR